MKADYTPQRDGRPTLPGEPIQLEITGPGGALHSGPVDSAVLSLARTVVHFGSGSPVYYSSFRRCTLRYHVKGAEHQLKLGGGFASLRSGRLTIVTEEILEHKKSSVTAQ